MLGLRPELMVDALVSAAIELSLFVSGRILARSSAAHGVMIRRAAGHLDPATAVALDRDEARERAMLLGDIAGYRPDAILVQIANDTDWPAWAKTDPRLAAVLSAYRPAVTVGKVLILRRDGAEK